MTKPALSPRIKPGVRLTVAVSRSSDLLVSAVGDPIWPARDDRDLDALSKVCSSFGAELTVAAQSRIGDSVKVAACVWAIGRSTEVLARLYAHLTSRTFGGVVGNATGLKGASNIEVIVVLLPDLTQELISYLHSLGSHQTIGIIAAEDEENLRLQVLQKSAARWLGGQEVRAHVHVCPLKLSARAADSDGRNMVFNRDAEIAELRGAASAGAGLMTVITHSDGIDAMFAKELTVCPIHEATQKLGTTADLTRTPHCVRTGICRRYNDSIDSAAALGRHLSPNEISTNVLVWCVCSGILPANGQVSRSWSLANFLMQNPFIGALVTTWEFIIVSEDSLSSLVSSLARGLPIGRSIAKFHRSRAAADGGIRLLLFGDPGLSLAPFRAVRQSLRNMPTRRRHTVAGSLRKVCFLRHVLETIAVQNSDDEPDLEDSRAAANAYEYAVAKGVDVELEMPVLCRMLRTSALAVLGRRGTNLCHQWMDLAQSAPKYSNVQCPSCGQNAAQREFRMRDGVTRRRLVTCPRCGVVADIPADWDLSLTRSPTDVVKLNGILPTASCDAVLILESPIRSDSVMLPWPNEPIGTLGTTVSLNGVSHPEGPLRIVLVLFSNSSFCALSVPDLPK